MTEKTVKIITCNGPMCDVECRGIIPVGWITFTGLASNRHLCPRCVTKGNVARQLYYQDMEKIDRERGD